MLASSAVSSRVVRSVHAEKRTEEAFRIAKVARVSTQELDGHAETFFAVFRPFSGVSGPTPVPGEKSAAHGVSGVGTRATLAIRKLDATLVSNHMG